MSEALDEWAFTLEVIPSFIDPGTPTQNAFLERFSGPRRDECLKEIWFVSLTDAQQLIEQWRVECMRLGPAMGVTSASGSTCHTFRSRRVLRQNPVLQLTIGGPDLPVRTERTILPFPR